MAIPADKLPISIAIVTGREDRPVIGGDTTILAVPPSFYVDTSQLGPRLDIGPALSMRELSAFLRDLAERQATELGDELHHAEFVVTRDPRVIRELGIMDSHRDCLECRTGLKAALAYQAAHPDTDMLIGQLFWAG